jgi:hypothetical protein
LSEKTSIQWCDSTVNPVMGCGGCELFPSPGIILDDLDLVAKRAGLNGMSSKALFKELVDEQFATGKVRSEVKKAVNTTNIWHLREKFVERVRGFEVEELPEKMAAVIRKHITCYAAVLHLNRGANILAAERSPKKGIRANFRKGHGLCRAVRRGRCVEGSAGI